MKVRLMRITPVFFVLLAATSVALAQQAAGAGDENGARRSIAAGPNVIVFISKAEGRVTVRGWERAEVLASSVAVREIELRRLDNARADAPATRVRISVSGEQEGDLRVNVPQDASVQVTAMDAEVSVEGVAEAHVESRGGGVELRHVARVSEATSVSGSVLLQKSTGSVRLKTVSGSVEVSQTQAQATGDDVRISSVSGDVLLDAVKQARVEADTTSGSVRLVGPLTREARYDLKTVSGDLLIVLPDEDGFNLNVRMTKKGNFVSELPLDVRNEASPPGSQHLTGSRGGGDATLNLSSYSGVVRLMRLTRPISPMSKAPGQI